MIKYQINVHVKNDDLPELIRGEEYDPKIFYHINFKGIFDTFDEGIDFIKKKFSKIRGEKNISDNEILNCMHKIKIDTDKCKKWESLFLNMVESDN